MTKWIWCCFIKLKGGAQKDEHISGCCSIRFMLSQLRGEDDLALFVEIAELEEVPEDLSELPLTIIIPSFIISELKIAFQMGFVIYIPFLIIDMIVSSTLMSMGMMMLPPSLISMPFKLLLFILVDGWKLVVTTVVTGFTR